MARGIPQGLIRPHGASRQADMGAGTSAGVPRDVRKTFTERVKEIDPIFKAGDFDRFWPVLRELVAMAPERRDLSLKKSHYLASLAARSLIRDDPRAALAFLAFADREVPRDRLTPFLVREREDFRRQAE